MNATLPHVPAQIRTLINLSRNSVACEHTEIADHMLRRMRGLLGRRELPAGSGMLLSPAPSVHMAFMRFPIDVVFLDRELNVIKVVPELQPWRAAGARKAWGALEMAAGEAERRSVRVGDRLALQEAHG